MSSVSILAPATPATNPATAPATVPTCTDCGDALYSGRCLNIGACADADATATRGAARTSAKYRPAAWTVSGGVD